MSARTKNGEPRPAAPRASRGKSATKAQAPSGSEVLSALGRGALAVLRSPDFGRLVVTGLLAGGFVAASLRVRERVLAAPDLAVARRSLATAPLPPFLSDRAREDLLALPLPDTVSAFHPQLVPALAYSLARIPWVERVSSVRLDFAPAAEGATLESDFPASVHFALEAARPIARIREGGFEVLVARSRRRVPGDRCEPGPRALPRIEGLPPEGSTDREAALEDSLALLSALETGSLSSRIGLVALRIGGRREAWLECASGARIEWGRLGSTPALTTDARVKRLAGFVAKGPALEQVERLALEWDEPVYVLKPVVAPAADPAAAVLAAVPAR